nr:hypothetical protein Iba_chr08aCG0370 [Ipomoea batatas]
MWVSIWRRHKLLSSMANAVMVWGPPRWTSRNGAQKAKISSDLSLLLMSVKAKVAMKVFTNFPSLLIFPFDFEFLQPCALLRISVSVPVGEGNGILEVTEFCRGDGVDVVHQTVSPKSCFGQLFLNFCNGAFNFFPAYVFESQSYVSGDCGRCPVVK